ncbi:hypothetical protein GCM10007242_13530 [Pigmentiphaga litoralis]|uniref:Nif11-like leader peptide family natural product precursor n=1 Tax=Pigmentiphaga litoralis TaxID=516702 RepID=UPI0016766DF6|nr:Nif11-like leader peptide family natural product precursor [Pigmentiphaga litoralis]GGX08890.1 hypothetical protein GCM10007242_13530 [Pigmentiphaga litoralis]
MPPDNLKTLLERAVIDTDLRERVTVILSASSAHVADRMAMLATDHGLPLTADEYRVAISSVSRVVIVPDGGPWMH